MMPLYFTRTLLGFLSLFFGFALLLKFMLQFSMRCAVTAYKFYSHPNCIGLWRRAGVTKLTGQHKNEEVIKRQCKTKQQQRQKQQQTRTVCLTMLAEFKNSI